MEDFEQALDHRTREGEHLGATLGASMGLPRSIRSGTYLEYPEDAEENGFSFATTAIELANRLAGQVAA